MKAWFCVLTMVVLSASPALTAGLGLHGSYWDSKEADDAWGGGALFRLDLHQNLQLDIRGSFFKFDGVKEDLIFTGEMMFEMEFDGEVAEVTIVWNMDDQLELDFEVIPVEVALLAHFDLHDRITPYFGGGVGYYFLDAKAGKSEFDLDWETKTSNEFGFFAVCGLHIRLNEHVSLFGEARYTWLKFDDVKYRFMPPEDPGDVFFIPLEYETELKMDGFGANFGLLFVF